MEVLNSIVNKLRIFCWLALSDEKLVSFYARGSFGLPASRKLCAARKNGSLAPRSENYENSASLQPNKATEKMSLCF